MPIGQRVVLIGGGHNALVAAFYLAKGGFRPVVLERRELVGGCAVTSRLANVLPVVEVVVMTNVYVPLPVTTEETSALAVVSALSGLTVATRDPTAGAVFQVMSRRCPLSFSNVGTSASRALCTAMVLNTFRSRVIGLPCFLSYTCPVSCALRRAVEGQMQWRTFRS